MPIALFVQVLILYLLFFQYDRCLLEFDAGTLLVRGTAAPEEDREELVLRLREAASEAYREKYVAWTLGEPRIQVEKNVLTIRQEGTLVYPFAGMGIRIGLSNWDAEAQWRGELLSPTGFLRMCRRFKVR